jgi:hypothetical protein
MWLIESIESETTQNTRNDKMMNMSMHDVAKLDLSPIRTKEGFSCSYAVRTLVVTDVNGRTFELVLFADDADALQIKA